MHPPGLVDCCSDRAAVDARPPDEQSFPSVAKSSPRQDGPRRRRRSAATTREKRRPTPPEATSRAAQKSYRPKIWLHSRKILMVGVKRDPRALHFCSFKLEP